MSVAEVESTQIPVMGIIPYTKEGGGVEEGQKRHHGRIFFAA